MVSRLAVIYVKISLSLKSGEGWYAAMDQRQTPLFDALLHYKDHQRYTFHVPGHKNGDCFLPKGKSVFSPMLTIDATEVEGLDDLHEPTGVIKEAQELLSNYYKTIKSYFLVNGTTVGNLTMVLSTCKPGEKVFVQRNSHKSIFNALELARVKPIFLSPKIDSFTQIPIGLDIDTVREAIHAHPDVKAMILTYPNYYGMAPIEYRSIIDLLHKQGALVLVDEAHGAHFTLGNTIPPSTLSYGADLVVHSAHKTLPAMTMGSYLHINSEKIDVKAVEKYLHSLQSSSPSYPIMASLDLARSFLATLKTKKIELILESIQSFIKELDSIGQIKVIHEEDIGASLDPFKLIIQLPQSISGYSWQNQLIQRGIYPELANPHHVLFVLGLDDRIDYHNVLECIRDSLKEIPKWEKLSYKINQLTPRSSLSLSYDKFNDYQTREVDLDLSLSYIAAEHVIPYPPGIPVVLQGEKLTMSHIKMIKDWDQAGAHFQNKAMKDKKIMVYEVSRKEEQV